MTESLLYACGLFCVVFIAKHFLRKIILWAIKFFGIFMLSASALAQEPEPEPTPTDSEHLATIASGANACAFGLGIVTGLLVWQTIANRSRFDL